MKHIEKRYLFQHKLTKQQKSSIEEMGTKTSWGDRDLVKKAKNADLMITTTKGYIIKGMAIKYNKQNLVIPIPDLTLVYFDSAYNANISRKNAIEKLINKQTPNENNINEDASNEIYQYYGYASNCIISLFTSLESFINFIIPEDSDYENKLKNKTEVYNKEQIQRNINFNDKLKKVLPQLTGKNFFLNQTLTNQLITDLKNIRDELVHPKSEENFDNQQMLINKLITFKYDKCFDAVSKFMNYYIPDYIKECPCNLDY